jgi:asparagine synthase (glutamine-hydrolysing)
MLLGATGDLLQRHGILPTDPGTTSGQRLLLSAPQAAVEIRPWGIAPLDDLERAAPDPPTGSWLALSGRPIGASDGASVPAGRLLERFLEAGAAALGEVDGGFAIAWFDGRTGRLHLIRDRFGIEPLFHAGLERGLLFGSRLRDLRATGALPGGLDGQGLAEFLTYCYVPGGATLDRAVRRVPPGGWIEIDPRNGSLLREEPWYRLSFARPQVDDEAAIMAEFRRLLEDAVARRLSGPRLGVFLSGGMDSSSVLTFARRHHAGTIATFAFRCAGASFDESTYARALAGILATEHTEVTYGEAEATHAAEIAAQMEVPFCDAGINVGTWLLGRAAAGRVGYVLTGDGGDELWASHPVYAAQRLLRVYERLPLPQALRRSLLRAAALLPDSDQKRDLRVKLKRILPPAGLPPDLGPFRWRSYYAPEELAGLLTPEAAALVAGHDPFRPVIDSYRGYDGPDDGLSPHLYSDYTTTSGYYFQRLGLLRHFGVEARLPFYDRAVVEFGARIPARLKLEGVERTKRLFRSAMQGILPDVINQRKDKLGHSIPLKNWLRTEGDLTAWIGGLLAPSVLRRRGLVRPEAVERMLDEHRRRRHNHSHRLWALAILEAWLQASQDRVEA